MASQPPHGTQQFTTKTSKEVGQNVSESVTFAVQECTQKAQKTVHILQQMLDQALPSLQMQLKKHVESLQSTINHHKQKEKEALTALLDAEHQCSELTQRNAALQDSLSSSILQQRNASAHSQKCLEALESEANHWKCALQKQEENFRRELDGKQAERTRVDAALQDAQAKLAEEQNKMQKLLKDMQRNEMETLKIQELEQNFKQQNILVACELANTKEALKRTLEENARCTKELRAAQQRCDELETQWKDKNEALNTTLGSQTQELRAARQRCDELETQWKLQCDIAGQIETELKHWKDTYRAACREHAEELHSHGVTTKLMQEAFDTLQSSHTETKQRLCDCESILQSLSLKHREEITRYEDELRSATDLAKQAKLESAELSITLQNANDELSFIQRELKLTESKLREHESHKSSLDAQRVAQQEMTQRLNTLRQESLRTIQKLLTAEEACESGYSCMMCLSLMNQPVVCGPCGHTFCRGCLFSKSKSDVHVVCPECRTGDPVTSIVSARALDILVSKYSYKQQVLGDLVALFQGSRE